MLCGAKSKGRRHFLLRRSAREPHRILTTTKRPINSGLSRLLRCRQNGAGGGKGDDMSRRPRFNAITDLFARRSLARGLCSNLTALALSIALVASGAWAQPAVTPLSTTEVGPGVYV